MCFVCLFEYLEIIDVGRNLKQSRSLTGLILMLTPLILQV